MENIVFNDLWARKSAGFLVPLFSVKTAKSLGIGDTGDMYGLIDWASDCGFSILQVLPLNDTSPGDPSPYAAISAFASNPLYIDISALEEVASSSEASHLMGEWEADGTIAALKNSRRIDYMAVRAVKMSLLWACFSRFMDENWERDTEKGDEFLAFINGERQWIKDYAFFRVLKEKEQEKHWRDWPEPLRCRDANAMRKFEENNSERIIFYQWLQWVFIKQWEAVRAYAHKKGVYLMGDIAFYPGMDSADVWGNSSFFQMNEDLTLSATSGAPPDYFNPDGQDWGTPLYDWDAMSRDSYSWWIKRVGQVCRFFDLYRLDHFRGFESYWRVPAGTKASEGCWIKGPGEDLLQPLIKRSMYENLMIPLAEDLGDITPDVHNLRNRLGISGYKTFIYGWGEGEHSGKASGYRYPEDYGTDFLATTGTHDTPTLSEWWDNLREDEVHALLSYLCLAHDADFSAVREAVLAKLFMSPANFLVLPFQDLFGMGAEERINLPGTFGPHNWSWRMPFCVEDLAGESNGHLSLASGFLTRIITESRRGGRQENEKGVFFSSLPAPGAVQRAEKGDVFTLWCMLDREYGNVNFASDPPCSLASKAEVMKIFPDGRVLYRGEIRADEPGTYSMNISFDDEVRRVDGCLCLKNNN